METKKRFRPNLRQYRILEAANKEISIKFTTYKFALAIHGVELKDNGKFITVENAYKKNGERAIRLNWFLIALNLVLASSNLFMYFFN